MSAHYKSEPAATASATLNTTVGPIHIALFANQTPLTCKNFLQHCRDNYYAGTIFHRVVSDFIIQGGDPTGTGSGGTSIYEYPEFEYDPEARDPNEKVVLKDELHSRLRFNRRGLVGMAKAEDGSYGSQFFITLANTERELNGQCTLFGRLEGDSIFNVLKIAEAERVEGSDRPVYPVKITSCEVGELGPLEGKLKDRQITATAAATTTTTADEKKKKKKAKKTGKTLLSFGDEGGDDEELPLRPTKPKFNTALVTEVGSATSRAQEQQQPREEKPIRKRPRSPSPQPERKHRPRSPDRANQLPLPDPESPRSPSPSPESETETGTAPAKQTRLERTNAQIETLKASMRRTVAPTTEAPRKKSALEAMIPSTAIRGRRRPAPGSSSSNGTASGPSAAETEALKLFNAFKAKLGESTSESRHGESGDKDQEKRKEETRQEERKDGEGEEEEEEQLCDLHFIANCQSCRSWTDTADKNDLDPARSDESWLSHTLVFGKDRLGKDLNWKREHADAESLVVIDPRDKERELTSGRGKKRGMERDRERERKRERAGELEWRRS
ncbi:hypothetical protein ASPZODRAFT_135420 [Penicilliopsis zonata CBS 506.65]|uniref:Peptidyl-prolyl isomerase CWC27 n=1 Tax=Penicilliopsis zonata CBS 506.65 TaxID=1073090 RepID=A0A1L9S9Y2_9EURO|nr:hypothetical protein ASPZODRAFT_135420 [Penicilliopsis zonata CBS 506.65]OJJ43992.1 hypothetical protein ASPZODRAFT_135420 [Penicilliopsis zonata CBS 506.65]